MLAVVVRAATAPHHPDASSEVRAGLSAAAACFMFYCTIQLADGELTRPHPVVWRAVHGVTIMYLVTVVFLLALSPEHTDMALALYEPRAGTGPLPGEDQDYTADCSLTLPNVWHKVNDRFFVAHLVGWFVKALILRDWGLMWICSLLFEVMEVSLEHVLPNFAECWWDRWFLDVFGCNFVGAVAGMRLAAWLGAKEYDWSGLKFNKPRSRPQRVAMQFVPKTFPKRYEWRTFSSWRRFGIAGLVVFGVMLGELNGFFLKSALRIPTDSYLNTARVVLMVPAVYASVVELQAFSTARTERVGATAWLVVSLGALEFALAVKQFRLRGSLATDPFSPSKVVSLSWLATLLLFVSFVLAWLVRLPRFVLSLVGRLVPLPFLALLAWDAAKTSPWRSFVVVPSGASSP